MTFDYKTIITAELQSLQEIKPIATNTPAQLHRGSDIKAVLFDIYGTILISTSYDTNNTTSKPLALERAFVKSGIPYPTEHIGNEAYFKNIITALIAEFKLSNIDQRNKGIQFPDISIVDCWQKTLGKCKIEAQQEAIQTLSFLFELYTNRVYPMPNMNSTIDTLINHSIPLGIISNAQFYTAPIMNFFRNYDSIFEDSIKGFTPNLISYSYKEMQGKPGTFLFERLIPELEDTFGIYPHEVLYIGNDMLNDILPAHKVGFQTALFAGDARSLQIREYMDDIKGLEPDYILTDLKQILEIVGLK